MAATADNSVKASGKVASLFLETGSFAVGAAGAANVVLWVWTFTGATTPVDPTSVKWGGVAGTSMTLIGSVLNIGANVKLSLWELKAPTAQTSTIYGLWPSLQDERGIVGISYKDVDQTTPKGTVATATGTNTTPSVNVTSVSGDVCLDGASFLDTFGAARTLAVGAGQTSIQEIEGTDTDAEGLGCSFEVASGVSTTMSWTISAAIDNWGTIAFATKGATGGGAVVNGGFRSLLGVGK